MTFEQAYSYAITHSERFRRHDARVKKAAESNSENATACMIFSTAPRETFYYGWDGTAIAKGKHSANRAKYLLERGKALLIE